MFCPKCGKEVLDNDNFCRFCGVDLRIPTATQKIEESVETEEQTSLDTTPDDELVLYDVKKHWMALVIPAFLTPLMFFYFIVIYLNNHGFFSTLVLISILVLIIYPVAKFQSDRMIITNKFVHVKMGVINPLEMDIPLDELGENAQVFQTSLGRIFDYGTVSLTTTSERFDYRYVQAPEEIQYIIDNPRGFVEAALTEE